MLLTGITPGRLSYFDKTELVQPIKIGNPRHPEVIYTWEQVIQLKAVDRLRERLSLQEIRKIIELLRIQEYKPALFSCNLVLIDDQLHFVTDWKAFGLAILQAARDNKGKVVVCEIGPIGDVVTELHQNAQAYNVLDFGKRIAGTPLALLA